jgi:hypothetical protein
MEILLIRIFEHQKKSTFRNAKIYHSSLLKLNLGLINAKTLVKNLPF